MIALWEAAAAHVGLIDVILLPEPHADRRQHLGSLRREPHHLPPFRHHLLRGLAGFLVGGALGLALAVGSSLNDSFRRYVSPYAILLNVTPGLALTPIVIAWFGFGY